MGRWHTQTRTEEFWRKYKLKGEEHMNKVVLMGRVGKEIELRQVGEHSMARFTLATSKKIKGKDVTQWHSVQAWGRTAEVVNQYSGKGKRMIVEGEIQYDSWDKKDGTKAYSTTINANNVSIIDFAEKETINADEVPF